MTEHRHDRQRSLAAGQRAARLVTLVVLPISALASLVVPAVLYGDELPGRVASHFDFSGQPDDSMTPTAFLVTAGLLLVLPGVVMLVAAGGWSARMPRPAPPFLAGLGGFLAALGGGIWIQTVRSQRGLTDWTEAANPGWIVALIMVVAISVGVVAALVAAQLPYDHASTTFAADPDAPAPTLDVGDGERVVFIERMSSIPLLALLGVIVASAMVLAALGVWLPAGIMAASGLPLLVFTTIRVQADQTGVTVRSAIPGIRFVTVGAEEIERATVIDVRPMKWGGWGYRGSLRFGGTAAVVLRKGPGVHMELSDDRNFVVTVDNPTGLAAVINGTRPGPVGA